MYKIKPNTFLVFFQLFGPANLLVENVSQEVVTPISDVERFVSEEHSSPPWISLDRTI